MGLSWKARKANAGSARFARDDTLKTMDFWGGKRVVLCTTPTSQHQGCGAPGALIWLGATLSHPAARKSAAHQNGAPGLFLVEDKRCWRFAPSPRFARGSCTASDLVRPLRDRVPFALRPRTEWVHAASGGPSTSRGSWSVRRWRGHRPRSGQDDILKKCEALSFCCAGSVKAVGALRQALALRGAGAPLQILFGRFSTPSCQKRARWGPRVCDRVPFALRSWAGWVHAASGGPSTTRGLCSVHRWGGHRPRSGQDDIFFSLRSG
jgi:hypothetical protein